MQHRLRMGVSSSNNLIKKVPLLGLRPHNVMHWLMHYLQTARVLQRVRKIMPVISGLGKQEHAKFSQIGRFMEYWPLVG